MDWACFIIKEQIIIKKTAFRFTRKNKGQSFIELAIVGLVLLLLLTGLVETSILLNQYITVVDAAREGARYGSTGKTDPYIRNPTGPYTDNPEFFDNIDLIIEGANSSNPPSGTVGNGALDPIILKDSAKEDVIITFYRVVGGSIEAVYPTSGHWHKFYPGQTTQVTWAQIQTTLSLNPTSLDTGVLVVEIFYSYHQLLKMPVFTNVIPDPINVHTYAIMPLPLAKPTPSP